MTQIANAMGVLTNTGKPQNHVRSAKRNWRSIVSWNLNGSAPMQIGDARGVHADTSCKGKHVQHAREICHDQRMGKTMNGMQMTGRGSA